MSNQRGFILTEKDAHEYCSRMIENARKNGLIIEYVIAHHIEGGFACKTPNFGKQTRKIIFDEVCIELGIDDDMEED